MISVNAVTLDYLYDHNVIGNIGYIHLDVEGMEMNVIEGSNKIIDSYRPIISFEQHIELDDYQKNANYLKNKNYSIYLVDETFEGCRPDCRNSFAFPNELPVNKIVNDINSKFNNFLQLR
jgi:hypothetical protein